MTAFADRHIGIDAAAEADMVSYLGYKALDDLIDAALPPSIRDHEPLDLPAPLSEHEAQARLRAYAAENRLLVNLLGTGFHGTITPPVLRRNVLENPAWYTAYTPYQPEISQGRLEALLLFQTMVADLVALDVANASLLDEATAAAEGLAMAARSLGGDRRLALVDGACHPQTLDVVATRAHAAGFDIRVVADPEAEWDDDAFAVLVQCPDTFGTVRDLAPLADRAHGAGALVVAATDLLACTVLRPPGEMGADIAVGSAQRFGLPLWYGGPHPGFIAARAGLERNLPGRLVGASVDVAGRPALRLALQTREQHIRRERATSNICTAQVLPAVVAALYAAYHGPEGLAAVAARVRGLATTAAHALRDAGFELVTSGPLFDTVVVRAEGQAEGIVARALADGINLRRVDADRVGLTFDETTTDEIVARALRAFGIEDVPADAAHVAVPPELTRRSDVLVHPLFHEHRSETEMLRYIRRLSDKDLALDRAMIPLGSCTMKLNSAAEMEPISWPGFADLHPFAPVDQAAGIRKLIAELEAWLAEITGYAAVSVQPNAGSQGELAGLLAVRRYHESLGEGRRRVCLIPASAHGTNAASAVLAGYRVEVVATAVDGGIDRADLERKLAEHGDSLAVLMVTYPSTHGVFEADIVEVCDLVHRCGGQVYLDGANLNALVGLARPGRFGADVSHLNLHKTFCIPHGGGGPGVGPVAVAAHLAPYLPTSAVVPEAGPATGIGAVSAAPWGSAGILPISWAYIAMMGAEGLTQATRVAVLSANYVAARLSPHYPILYRGPSGLVAHECVVDLRRLTKETGVTVHDVAKRLIDYGFHAPTVSFPVAGTLMIEPTESESREALDRFCEAMIAIRAEIDEVGDGGVPPADSVLRRAPHTAADLIADEWERPYSRSSAAFPGGVEPESKYWPPVGRIDEAYGDRNLVCSCQ